MTQIEMEQVNQPEQNCYTILGFCKDAKISRTLFYRLEKKGLMPKTLQIGKRRLISIEAYKEWRQVMQSGSPLTAKELLILIHKVLKDRESDRQTIND